MANQLKGWGTRFLDLSEVKVEEVAPILEREKPHILLAPVEKLEDEDVRAALLTLTLAYVAIDEAHVGVFGYLEFLF
jgi:superfamily II DNA helicase RecQ